ncbi:MAG: DUF362 domain-containing protein [Candidatus Omnitrophota bacterium]
MRIDRFFYKLECFLKKTQISRRGFLKICFGSLLYFISNNLFMKAAFAKSDISGGRVKKDIRGNYDLVLAEGEDPYQNTVIAVEKMGGMEKFVRKGDVVVVKPNIAWDRSPEQAANTNPSVVAAVIDMCYKAGAKRVNVFDVTCNEERRCYQNSGIAEAAEKSGAFVYYPDHWNVVKARFPYKSEMENWPVLRDAVQCDVFINVPVLKNHGLTRLTVSMKNLMGICSGTRGLIHMNIGEKLVDLTQFINPDLTVIDATRVLTSHGPSGGSLEDVVTLNKLIVGTDPVLSDAFACTLVNVDPMELPNIKAAAARKVGETDINKASILKVKV